MVLSSATPPEVYINDIEELKFSDLHDVSDHTKLNDSDREIEPDELYELGKDDFLFINVCGMKYVTLKKTIERYPATLLGDKNRRDQHFSKMWNAYFFDRNRQCFESILYYYQSDGILVRPPQVPMEIFIEEVTFFDLGEDEIYKLRTTEGYVPPSNNEVLPKNIWQRRVWELMEYPDSSRAARVFATVSVMIIVLSVIVFCLETMPEFSTHRMVKTGNGTFTLKRFPPHKYAQPWFTLEVLCISWFTLEYVIRLLSSPCKKTFIKSILNMIDLLAILPYLISMSVTAGVLRIFRLVRIFRIFKLSRHSNGLQILGKTLQASVSELGMLIFFLVLGVILFSSAMYYAENGQNEMFQSIPDAFWYSIVTMTTVGYGDKSPVTLYGKIVGSLCAVSGVLTIALPVPVIVSKFTFYCKRDQLSNNFTSLETQILWPPLVS